MTAPTERFSSRVDNYVKYRPSYPPEVVGLQELALEPGAPLELHALGQGARLLGAPGEEEVPALAEPGVDAVLASKLTKQPEAPLHEPDVALVRPLRAHAPAVPPARAAAQVRGVHHADVAHPFVPREQAMVRLYAERQLTLEDYLAFTLQPLAGRTPAECRALADRFAVEVIARTEGFAELGSALAMPIKHYSSGMRARLAFGLSLAIDFDCYLIDEIIAVGDLRFREKCEHELFERRAHKAFVIASHDTAFLKATCERAIIVEGGRAKLFEDMDVALEIYAALNERDAAAA